MKRLFWFVAAGGSGFLVDAGSLTLLVQLTSLSPFIARILSIALAVTTTWLINRRLTFEKSPHSTAAEATRYGSVAFITALINYGLFSVIMLIWPALWPAIAAGMATIVTMFLSFFGYSKLVFSVSSTQK
jgi:putative flippase GtrA